MLSAPTILRDSAREQVRILTVEALQARLRTLPVSELRGLVGRGARLGNLERAGFRTVADVHNARADRLGTVPGVGPTTAQQVSDAADKLAFRVSKDTRFRFEPDRRTPEQTQLLGTLAAIRYADSAVSSLREPMEFLSQRVTPLIAEANPATSKWAMLWSRRAKKDAALSALGKLDGVLADPKLASLSHTLDGAERALDSGSYSPDQLWQDYVSDAASFNALLSTLGGAGETDDVEAAQGFIGPELHQKITAVPLDTSLLRATLRGYQVFGAQYAVHQERSILGDEMGLGKTVQALAVFAHLAAKGQQRFLVVCPASVQINWLKEIERHSQLKAYSLHGRDREATGRRWLQRGGVAVTTFSTLGSLKCLDEAEIAMLVVDEAHYVKNRETKRAEHVRTVNGRAQRTLFLTGTPMENRVEEFRNLVSYLQPRLASRIDAGDTVASAKAFRRAVAPVYLRRNQEDVLTELPDKIEVEDWVQLTSADSAAYRQAVVDRNLMRMRQAAFTSHDSAKLERLAEIVEEALDDGLKVIVFSYFLGVLDIINRRLGSVVVGQITGSVTAAARQQLVDTFTQSERPAVLLSQIDAGGTGLNIQAASVVVIAEPQWKPSTEEQAIARAFRMGQIRTVQVHRLLAKGSVDDRVLEVQHEKRLLFDEYARKSDAKDADSRSVDPSEHRPDFLDDKAVPLERRIILAEQHRLGIVPGREPVA
nr:SNF2-related protein [Actinopolymorpha pittospori]